MHGYDSEIVGCVCMPIDGRGPKTMFIMRHQHRYAKFSECISGEAEGGCIPSSTTVACVLCAL